MTPADEVRRWVRTFETVPDDLRVGYEPVAEALLASAPDLIGPTLVHGDYRLGNMLCDGAKINGIIDWELWTASTRASTCRGCCSSPTTAAIPACNPASSPGCRRRPKCSPPTKRASAKRRRMSNGRRAHLVQGGLRHVAHPQARRAGGTRMVPTSSPAASAPASSNAPPRCSARVAPPGTSMTLRAADQFHIGIVVEDFASALAELRQALWLRVVRGDDQPDRCRVRRWHQERHTDRFRVLDEHAEVGDHPARFPTRCGSRRPAPGFTTWVTGPTTSRPIPMLSLGGASRPRSWAPVPMGRRTGPTTGTAAVLGSSS